MRAPLRLSRACLGKSAATWWRCGRQARGPACCAVRRGPSFPSLSRRQLNALSDHVCARVVGGTVATFCYLQVAAARRALKEMIDYLTTVHGISPYEAMVLCSVAADFKIAEVVDSKSSPKVTHRLYCCCLLLSSAALSTAAVCCCRLLLSLPLLSAAVVCCCPLLSAVCCCRLLLSCAAVVCCRPLLLSAAFGWSINGV